MHSAQKVNTQIKCLVMFLTVLQFFFHYLSDFTLPFFFLEMRRSGDRWIRFWSLYCKLFAIMCLLGLAAWYCLFFGRSIGKLVVVNFTVLSDCCLLGFELLRSVPNLTAAVGIVSFHFLPFSVAEFVVYYFLRWSVSCFLTLHLSCPMILNLLFVT